MQIIGDGGHAKVIRELIRTLTWKIDDELLFIAVGRNEDRQKEVLAHPGRRFAILAHPKVVLAPCEIGEGTAIMAGVVVQPGCIIGRHVILNTGCTLDHDCEIGDYAHIAPGANLCGGVKVGEGALVGVGVGVAPGAVIPPWCVVRAARLDIQV